MPILLDTPHPHTPGHGAAITSCTHVKVKSIDKIHIEELWARFTTWYGTVDGEGVFTGIPGTERSWIVRNIAEETAVGLDENGEQVVGVSVEADPQFSILLGMSGASAVGELAWDSLGRALYNWLLNNEHYAGDIV